VDAGALLWRLSMVQVPQVICLEKVRQARAEAARKPKSALEAGWTGH
jgi:hypothetical protein